MDEFVENFTSLLWYVTYINEDKAKVQRFLNCLPSLTEKGLSSKTLRQWMRE